MIFDPKQLNAAVLLEPNVQSSIKSRKMKREDRSRDNKKTGKIENQDKKEGPKYQGKGTTQLESANRDQTIRKLKWERGEETTKNIENCQK